jgi:hypothetical protein
VHQGKGNDQRESAVIGLLGELSSSPAQRKTRHLPAPLVQQKPVVDSLLLAEDGAGDPKLKKQLGVALDLLNKEGVSLRKAAAAVDLPYAKLHRYVVERVGEYELTQAAYDALSGSKETVTLKLLRDADRLIKDANKKGMPMSLRRLAFELAIPHNTLHPYLTKVRLSDGRECWGVNDDALAILRNEKHTGMQVSDKLIRVGNPELGRPPVDEPGTIPAHERFMRVAMKV